MRKISFLALLFLAFGMGCGSFTKCDEAKSSKECNASFFESGKFNCTWDAKADNNKGKCLPTGDYSYAPY